jgi:hypothetical protein
MRHFAIALVCLAAACAGGEDPPVDEEVRCDEVTDDDEFVVGLNKLGEAGNLGFTLMSGDPAPPIRGDNIWVIQIDENASPVTGAAINVQPFMPAHGHGAGKPVNVAPEASPGQYRLSPVNLWMPGVWETTILVTSPAASDEVVFRFCIPS